MSECSRAYVFVLDCRRCPVQANNKSPSVIQEPAACIRVPSKSARSASPRRNAMQISLHEDAVQCILMYTNDVRGPYSASCGSFEAHVVCSSMNWEVGRWYTTSTGSEEPREVCLECMHRAHGSEDLNTSTL